MRLGAKTRDCDPASGVHSYEPLYARSPAMRMKHTALLLTAGFILMPTMLWSQLPGQGGGFGGRDGGFGGRDGGSGGPGGFRDRGGPGGPGGPAMGGAGMNWGGGGGRSRMFGDPEQLFAQYSKDGQTIRKEDLPQQMQMGIDMLGPQLGLTGNQWSREDLQKATERIRGMMGQAGMTFGRPGGTGPGGPGGPGMGGPSEGDRDRRLDEAFKRMDRNEDGVLQFNEMSETLQAEREKYDTNHNGVIELNEFRDYVTARFSNSRSNDSPGRVRGDDGPGGPLPAEEEERKRPTILRAGNLPRDFPYASLDTDLDGQVGLYEWKGAGRRISEFLPMDLNNDGYLTVEEYYRWRKQGDEIAMKNGTGSREFGRMPGGMNMMAFNNPGMMPGGNRFGMGGGGMTPGMPGMNNWGGRMPGGPGMDMSNFRQGAGGGFGGMPGGMDMSRRWGAGGGGGYGMNPMSPGNWGNAPGGMMGGGMMGGGMAGGGPMTSRFNIPGGYAPGAMAPGGSYPMPGTGGFGGGSAMAPGMSTMPFPGRGDRGPPGMNAERGDRGPGVFLDRGPGGPGGDRGPGDRGPGGRRGGQGGDGGDRGPGRNRGGF